MKMNYSDLTLDNLGQWPNSLKMGLIAAVCVIILLLGYWIDLSGQLNKLKTAQNTEVQIKEQLKIKFAKMANLRLQASHNNKAEKSVNAFVSQLPTHADVPAILQRISYLGASNGLRFKLLKPLPAQKLSIGQEIPIDIIVTGNYHQLASFISDMANSDYFVSFQNFVIQREIDLLSKRQRKALIQKTSSGMLQMKLIAQIYHA